MRVPITVLATVGALAVATPALAKEVSSVTVCGTDGCSTLTAAKHDVDLHMLAEGGEIVAPPSKGAPHYEVTIAVSDGVEDLDFTTHWVPSLNLIRGERGTWMEMLPAQRRTLANLDLGLEPFAASALPLSASPESRAAAEPTSDNMSEVFAPAQTGAPSPPGSGLPWQWIVLAGVMLAAGASALVARARSGGSTIRPWPSRSP